MYKRKHGKSTRDYSAYATATSPKCPIAPVPDPCLYIQAHEADVIRGPRAASAPLLEYQDLSAIMTPGGGSGSGLIQWGPYQSSCGDLVDTQHSNLSALWLDRYDVRLLLDRLPDFRSEKIRVRPPSPTGWSDLPSDSEDTFFFSPDEFEDYHREKRRRLIERGREERLRAIANADDQERDSDPWGGSDEEPDEAQREFIRRTASHIVSSPNSAQLEMRILANYGTDKRFAFLRGRWSRVWRTEKERVKQLRAEEAKKTQSPTALASLGGLAGYGDSDTDDEKLADKETDEPEDAANPQCIHEEAIKEARRARAKEWSARRRAQQPEPQTRTMQHDDI